MNYIDLLNRFYNFLQCNQVSNNAQLLYYTLLQINNKCGWSEWFSRTNVSLAGLMCISENTMKRAREELKELGLIDVMPSPKRRGCTQYRILCCVNEYQTSREMEVQIDVQTDTQIDIQADTQIDTQVDTQIDTQVDTQIDTQIDTQTNSINKLKQKQRHKPKSVSNDTPERYAQNEEVDKAFKAFVEYRKSIKAPMTERAIQLAVKKLEDLAPGDPSAQTAILNQSVLNGWKGLFPLKDGAEGKKATSRGRPNTFHNFDQRDVDYDALIAVQLRQQGGFYERTEGGMAGPSPGR
jgi:hypothetical protein